MGARWLLKRLTKASMSFVVEKVDIVENDMDGWMRGEDGTYVPCPVFMYPLPPYLPLLSFLRQEKGKKLRHHIRGQENLQVKRANSSIIVLLN